MKFSRNCSSITSVFTVFSTIFVLWTLGPTEAQGRESYQTEDGKECYYCPAGTHKVGDCPESGLQARCEDCSVGFFQNVPNIANSCAHCKTQCYLRNEVLVEQCTPTMDLQCECKEGYYRHGTGGLDEAKCLEHSLCPAGEGVIANGSSTDDTRCEPCVRGTYSADISLSPCQICTLCTDWDNYLYTAVECSSTTNTVCGSRSPQGLTTQSVTGIAVATFFVGCLITGVVLVSVYRYRKQRASGTTDVPLVRMDDEGPVELGAENPTHVEDTVTNVGPTMDGGDDAERSSPIRDDGQQGGASNSATSRDIKTDRVA